MKDNKASIWPFNALDLGHLVLGGPWISSGVCSCIRYGEKKMKRVNLGVCRWRCNKEDGEHG